AVGKAYEPATMERDKKADSVVECPVKKEPAHDGMKKPVDSGRKEKAMDDCPPRKEKVADDCPRKEKPMDDHAPRKEKAMDECHPRKEKVADDCPRKEKAMDDHAPRKEAKDASPPKEKDAADGKMVPPDDE